MNKNISVWRGVLSPPTYTHIWLKDDGMLYHHLGHSWVPMIQEATEEMSGLLSKTDKLILDLLNENLHWN